MMAGVEDDWLSQEYVLTIEDGYDEPMDAPVVAVEEAATSGGGELAGWLVGLFLVGAGSQYYHNNKEMSSSNSSGLAPGQLKKQPTNQRQHLVIQRSHTWS
jgi:hypothetical protein